MVKDIFIDYLELARPKHVRHDMLIPVIITALSTGTIILAKGNPYYFVIQTMPTAGIVVTALSILAGFNMTSLSILATTDSKIVQQLRQELMEGNLKPKIQQIFSYFSWAILVQLTLLIISIAIVVIISTLNFSPTLNPVPAALTRVGWIVFVSGLLGITYSIILTIRNISILYYFLKANSANGK